MLGWGKGVAWRAQEVGGIYSVPHSREIVQDTGFIQPCPPGDALLPLTRGSTSRSTLLFSSWWLTTQEGQPASIWSAKAEICMFNVVSPVFKI